MREQEPHENYLSPRKVLCGYNVTVHYVNTILVLFKCQSTPNPINKSWSTNAEQEREYSWTSNKSYSLCLIWELVRITFKTPRAWKVSICKIQRQTTEAIIGGERTASGFPAPSYPRLIRLYVRIQSIVHSISWIDRHLKSQHPRGRSSRAPSTLMAARVTNKSLGQRYRGWAWMRLSLSLTLSIVRKQNVL